MGYSAGRTCLSSHLFCGRPQDVTDGRRALPFLVVARRRDVAAERPQARAGLPFGKVR